MGRKPGEPIGVNAQLREQAARHASAISSRAAHQQIDILLRLRQGTRDAEPTRQRDDHVQERCELLLSDTSSTRLPQHVWVALGKNENWAALYGLTAYLNALAYLLDQPLIPEASCRQERRRLYENVHAILHREELAEIQHSWR
jgi:hypothetical protein